MNNYKFFISHFFKNLNFVRKCHIEVFFLLFGHFVYRTPPTKFQSREDETRGNEPAFLDLKIRL